MGALDDVLPPDRADWAKVTPALQELLRALKPASRTDNPTVEIKLDATSWKAIRNQFARPHRAEPKEFCIGLAEGTVWVRRDEPEAAEEPPDADGSPSWLPKTEPADETGISRGEAAIYVGPTNSDDSISYVGPWRAAK